MVNIPVHPYSPECADHKYIQSPRYGSSPHFLQQKSRKLKGGFIFQEEVTRYVVLVFSGSSGKIKPPFNFLDFCCRKWGEEPYRGDCMYLWSAHSAEYGWTRYVYHSCRGRMTRENYVFPVPVRPEKLVSRDGFGRLVLLILHTQTESINRAYSRDSCHFPRRRPHIIYRQPILG